MSNCVDCSGETGNVNPLDCNNQFMQCGNPCRTTAANTPQCETLPSQIQNFTDQFFGTVIKTEVNGEVVWSLPCQLDIGLPNNPRAQGEGLACYFLRLFRDGIGGLVGPKGAKGDPGTNGNNTYTVTTQPFTQPTLNNPMTQIVVTPNPSLVEGIGVFIEGSGSYEITNVSPGGVIFLTLVAEVSNPVVTVPAGSLVVPVGVPGVGNGPKGDPGPQGLQGPQGVPGVPGTSIPALDNGTWTGYDSTGTPLPGLAGYTVTGAAAKVVCGTQTPGFAPKYGGTYLVNVAVPIWETAGTAGLTTVWLYNSHTGSVYPTTPQMISGLASGQIVTMTITATIVTTGVPGENIQLFASTTTAGDIIINGAGLQMSWVRLS